MNYELLLSSVFSCFHWQKCQKEEKNYYFGYHRVYHSYRVSVRDSFSILRLSHIFFSYLLHLKNSDSVITQNTLSENRSLAFIILKADEIRNKAFKMVTRQALINSMCCDLKSYCQNHKTCGNKVFHVSVSVSFFMFHTKQQVKTDQNRMLLFKWV